MAIAVYKALEVIEFPHPASDAKRQLIRSSTSTAANYRAACRAKSTSDFLNKLKIVEEELDESMFWMEFFEAVEVQLDDSKRLYSEMNELLSIIVSSIRTTKSKI